MLALAPQTLRIFDQITTLDCIRDYVLVGGTALTLQIGTRLSEDLDFMRWSSDKKSKDEVNWVQIKKELSGIGTIQNIDIFDFKHVEFMLEDVKISFYISDKSSPLKDSVRFQNNLFLADLLSITAMKMEVMLRRNNFRDYYDLYALLKNGIDFKAAIELSLKYSKHLLTTKNLFSIISDSSRFQVDHSFEQLNPIYHVNAMEIESYIKDCIKKFIQ